MVGYSCSDCNGSGFEKVVIIRSGEVKEIRDECQFCLGAGGFTNGRPNVHRDVGITDPYWIEWMKE